MESKVSRRGLKKQISLEADIEKFGDDLFAFAQVQRKEWRTETNVTRLTNGKLFGADDRKPFQIDKSIKPHTRSSTSLSLSLSLPLPSSIHFTLSIEERTYQLATASYVLSIRF